MTLHLRHKTSTVAGKAPQAGDLERGELAINLVDKKVYTKDATDAIIELGGSSALEVGDTAPASPMSGMLWWKSDTGGLYLRYKDANGEQWVGIGGPAGKDGQDGKDGKDGKDGTIPSGTTAPGTPAAGDLWVDTTTAATPLLKRYDGTNWVVVAPPAAPPVLNSATPPTAPADNVLWFNSNTGKLSIYHNDGNTKQWVSIN